MCRGDEAEKRVLCAGAPDEGRRGEAAAEPPPAQSLAKVASTAATSLLVRSRTTKSRVEE